MTVNQKVVDLLYTCYGSGTGYLFGITPQQRPAVEAVVKVILEYVIDGTVAQMQEAQADYPDLAQTVSPSP